MTNSRRNFVKLSALSVGALSMNKVQAIHPSAWDASKAARQNYGLPANGDYPEKWAERVDNEATYSTNNGLPGAVIHMIVDDKEVLKKAYGYQRFYNEKTPMPNPEPMKTNTLFDLASLSKIFSTTLAYMQLVDKKSINIEDPVSKYVPSFTGGDKNQVKVRHLLQHTSGLPSSFHFYNPSQVPPGFYSQSRDKTIEILPLVPLVNPPEKVCVYSDLNFVLLGIILEKITGMRQDNYVSQYIYQPLKLKNTLYAPVENGVPQNACEASERCGNTRDGHVSFPNIRTETLQGQVQDELAFYSMEQVSGNAGLFSTADDLGVLGRLILNGGSYGGFTLCSEQTVRLFTGTLNIDKSYALGFQIPTANTELIYGLLLPAGGAAVAHTGWTGKCFVIDFANRSIIIILTNKKHTPVIPMGQSFDRFEGDLLPTSLYGSPVQLFYGGLLERQFGQL